MNSLVVVKVGGSLALYPEKLRTLCTKLTKLSQKHKLIIVPGGGEFADVVRSLYTRFSMSCGVSHKMAIFHASSHLSLRIGLERRPCHLGGDFPF